jgi:hypothetical protein
MLPASPLSPCGGGLGWGVVPVFNRIRMYQSQMSRLLITCLFVLPVSLFPWALAEPSVFRVTVSKVWTVESAKEEAFREVPLSADVSGYPDTDPNFGDNKNVRDKGGGRVNGRLITVFPDGGYCVKNPEQTERHYYLESGQLQAVQFIRDLKAYKYAANPAQKDLMGKLITVSIQVAEGESFVFSTDGVLIAHWVKENCFRADGSSCGTRKKLGE